MSNEKLPLTVSMVRHEFGTFFERVLWLYNLVFFKEEKDCWSIHAKKYADEMFEANHINEYVFLIINEAIEKFALLDRSQLKEMNPDRLRQLNDWIHISIRDIVDEISARMSH